jgi:hypothetical protein
VKEYTAYETVKARADAQLAFDIIQAEQDIFSYCGHDFTADEYTPLPVPVKIALIKVTEYYSLINSDESGIKGYKSEKIGDYQYQVGDSAGTPIFARFALASLLKPFILPGKGGPRFRLRGI